jgi:septation ring formation regulator EzrA
MQWDLIKNWYWAIGAFFVLIAAWFRISVFISKSKEKLDKVAENEKGIKAVKHEISEMKGDIADIKESQEKQGRDISAILQGVQAMMTALASKDCNIGSAQEKFNEHLAKR